MKEKIIIVDYGMGNLGSVKRKLDSINVSSFISDKPSDLEGSDKLILPGVGHFSNAVRELKDRDLWEPLCKQVLVLNKPILGICLGMQLMSKHSEEGDVEGFGWFDASVVRFKIKNPLKYKVPHMGWNQVEIKKTNRLFNDVDLTSGFYFVHSYHMKCNNPEDVLTETIYEYPFVSSVQRNNIFGVQYHPEKSHDAGVQLLKNFVNI